MGPQPAPRGRDDRPRATGTTRRWAAAARASLQADPLLRHRDRRRLRRRPGLPGRQPQRDGAHLQRPALPQPALARAALPARGLRLVRARTSRRDSSSLDEHYGYFGGQAGRRASSSALSRTSRSNVDIRGFMRGRTDQLAPVAAGVHELRWPDDEHLGRRPLHRRHDDLLLEQCRSVAPTTDGIASMPAVKRAIAVRCLEERTVADVLARAGADERAVEEGRVFVGRRRVRRGDEPVHGGRRRRDRAAARGGARRCEVLCARGRPRGRRQARGNADHRRPRRGGARARARRRAGARRRRGAPAPDVAARSRRERRGRVRADEGARRERLARARADGRATSGATWRSRASAPAPPSAARGTRPSAARAIRACARRTGATPCPRATRYARRARAPGGEALLAVAPVTGRTHQIRVHASHAGRAAARRPRLRRPGARHAADGPGARAATRRAARGARRRPGRGRRAAVVAVSPMPPELADAVVRAWRRARGVGGCRVVRPP